MALFATIIGILAVIFSFLAKIVGHPDQMLKNYRRKSTEGVAISMFITSFLAYLFYTIHGILQKDWVVISGQSLGVFTTGIILWQAFYYRKKNSDKTNI
ncbi:MAG: PQ-loop repeat-containing protein [Candidatus Taylorbacteria bacterium]|nr:PQ-loop repeat-containing protein [Candidatus Taylorbacteria bacterium]